MKDNESREAQGDQMARESDPPIGIPVPKLVEWSSILEMLDASKIGMLGCFDCIGVRSFATILEYEYFTPDTPMNALYQMAVLNRFTLAWFLVVIPKDLVHFADAVARRVGLVRTPGPPTQFTGGAEHFPEDANVWTLSNVPEHFAYSCNADMRNAAYAAEDVMIERVVREHYARVIFREPGQ